MPGNYTHTPMDTLTHKLQENYPNTHTHTHTFSGNYTHKHTHSKLHTYTHSHTYTHRKPPRTLAHTDIQYRHAVHTHTRKPTARELSL